VTKDFPLPWDHFKNVVLEFSDFGTPDVNSSSVSWQPLPHWHKGVLALPVLIYNGVRYERISLPNATFVVSAYEVL